MDNDVEGAPGCVELETYDCMNVCKDASTDNWRRCLRDCHSIKANEASSFKTIASSMIKGEKSSRNYANAIIVGGVIITVISLASLFYMQRRHK